MLWINNVGQALPTGVGYRANDKVVHVQRALERCYADKSGCQDRHGPEDLEALDDGRAGLHGPGKDGVQKEESQSEQCERGKDN